MPQTAQREKQRESSVEGPSGSMVTVAASSRAAASVASRNNISSSRICGVLLIAARQWFHFSLLRQVLLESHSMFHRISRSRYRRTALNYAEVCRSLPQVSCSDSQNETQFCSASIQRLSAERPYLSIADLRLFAAGFFQAEKWFLHMRTERHSEKQDSQRSPEGSNSMLPLAVQQTTNRAQRVPLPSQDSGSENVTQT